MDIVDRFIELYSEGKILEALQLIAPAPNTPYESLKSTNPELLHLIVNYVDSSIYGYSNSIFANVQMLLLYLQNNKKPSLAVQNFIKTLNYEGALLYAVNSIDPKKNLQLHPEVLHALKSQQALQKYEINAALEKVPVNYRHCFRSLLELIQNWNRLKQQKPRFCALFFRPLIPILLPWHTYKYPYSPSITYDKKTIPLFFLEPCEFDFAPILDSVKDQPAVFAFASFAQFAHMLQFPIVAESLNDPNHLIYILEKYPNDQFLVQNYKLFKGQQFTPLFFGDSSIKNHIELFLKYFKETISQTVEELQNKTTVSNQLYYIARELPFSDRRKLLGASRAAALQEYYWEQESFRIRSSIFSDSERALLKSENYFETLLQSSKKYRQPRLLVHKQKIKIAHVVPQICPLGHAPTRLMHLLLTQCNRQVFDPIVVCTERMCLRFKDYPQIPIVSPSSQDRGVDVLAHFQSLNIPVKIANPYLSLEETAKATESVLKNANVDIAVFHGPDTINLLASTLTNVPLRVLFEHGMPPEFPGFDLALVSSEEALELYQDVYKQLNITPKVLKFCVDARAQWKSPAPTRQSLGLPENAIILTTISNHLQTRLSPEMCRAIEEILASNPNAFYAPMGTVHNENELRARFSKDINQRIKFLMFRDSPSQDARVMDIYLNEFPVGSGVSILDAMASGCPVVTMYDEHGAQASRYGGVYFGIDRAITTNDRNAYVALANRLIRDKDMRREWREHALSQYDKFSDVAKYVQGFEEIILQHLS